MEFLTVATQYCGMLEQCQKQSREELLDSLLRILPVLYWNAQVLPAMETMGQFLPDDQVTEADYEYVRGNARALEKGLQASGLPLSAYLRKLILGESIQAAPSEELRRLRTEIHQIGNNINQLARKANAGFASRDEVTRALRMLDRVYELMYQLSQQSWQ